VLRKLHLDEFPQLINVLKGEMSLIGPRPERPEFTQRLAVEIPGYLDRLLILPGVTGLAQINLPPDTDLESVRRKLCLDLRYVSEAGLLLDLRMLLCTATRVIGMPGGLAMRAFGLYRSVPMSDADAANFEYPQDDAAVVPRLSTNRVASHPTNGKKHSKNGNGHAMGSAEDFALPVVSDATNS
jgi:hypothetical protein